MLIALHLQNIIDDARHAVVTMTDETPDTPRIAASADVDDAIIAMRH